MAAQVLLFLLPHEANDWGLRATTEEGAHELHARTEEGTQEEDDGGAHQASSMCDEEQEGGGLQLAARDSSKWSLLHHAAFHGHAHVLGCLLKRKVLGCLQTYLDACLNARFRVCKIESFEGVWFEGV